MYSSDKSNLDRRVGRHEASCRYVYLWLLMVMMWWWTMHVMMVAGDWWRRQPDLMVVWRRRSPWRWRPETSSPGHAVRWTAAAGVMCMALTGLDVHEGRFGIVHRTRRFYATANVCHSRNLDALRPTLSFSRPLSFAYELKIRILFFTVSYLYPGILPSWTIVLLLWVWLFHCQAYRISF